MSDASHEEASVLYFGYGSNLDREDWQAFCEREGFGQAKLQPIAAAWLPDWQLAFDYRSVRRGGGALNIRPGIGMAASGCLFAVDALAIAALDRKEGAPQVYRRFDCIVLDGHGHEHRCFSYQVTPERRTSFTAPSDQYLEICRRGRLRLGQTLEDLEAVAAGRPAPACQGLFVYGTLRRGELRASYFDGVPHDWVRDATVRGTLRDHGDYPGLTLDGEGGVHGEYLEIPGIAGLLPVLDEVEGFAGFGKAGNLYRRALVDVDLPDGRRRRAWTYVSLADAAPVIESGDWCAHRRRR